MQIDPQYVADTLRDLRRIFSLTQENLAELAGLTSRTIEKMESGRHRPNEQTLRSLSRALGVNASMFVKPSPEEAERQKAEMMEALRKTVLVPTSPVVTAADFLAAFANRHGFRFDMSAVVGDEALDLAVGMIDWIGDCNDLWDDISQVDRVRAARDFAALCERMAALGYGCHFGSHRQQLKSGVRPPLVLEVGLMVLLPLDQSQQARYALVTLDGGWESVDQPPARDAVAAETRGLC